MSTAVPRICFKCGGMLGHTITWTSGDPEKEYHPECFLLATGATGWAATISISDDGGTEPAYSREQLIAYGDAQWSAAIEEAAKIVEFWADPQDAEITPHRIRGLKR